MEVLNLNQGSGRLNDEVFTGDLVGNRYEIVRRIGSGAGGRIYLALDKRLGNRDIAIKFYEPDALIQDLSEHVRSGIISRDVYDNEVSNIYHRFRQEAVGISRLDHSAIVKVYDYQDREYEVVGDRGNRSRTQPFLCMEFIEGQTLEEALSGGNIERQMGLLIGAQVADGLAFAHSVGLVHRDLKPSNIMVQGVGAGIQAKIIDWGVAKVIADEAKAAADRLNPQHDDSEDIKTRGLLLGTPKFIAPEHFERGGANWSPASDVFSLGMILFRILTKRPLRRESYVGECLTGSDRQMLREACEGQPELADVALSCLSEVREDRLSAEELRDYLFGLFKTGIERTTSGQSDTVSQSHWEPSGSLGLRETTTVVHQMEDRNSSISSSSVVSSVVSVIHQNRHPLVLGGGIAAVIVIGILAWTAMRSPGETALEVDGVVGVEELLDTVVVESVDDTLEEAEDNAFEMVVLLTSKPEATVYLKEGADLRKLGETPLEYIFTHADEAQRLIYRPALEKHRKVYTDLEVTVFAQDFTEGDDLDIPPEHPVKLRCADITDPNCNDYLERFNKVFEEDE